MLSWTVRVISRHENRADPAQICETWTSADVKVKDLFQCSDFGSTRIVHVTLPAVSCCILLYPVVVMTSLHLDLVTTNLARLFGSLALRLNFQLERWSFGCRRCIWCISFVIFVIFVIFVFCFRFALDFFEIVISHTRTLWHQFSFARRYFPFLGILYFFWHRFLKIISLISVSRLLQVSYLPGYGLWCKPWYCAALSSRNTFESNCFNICKLYIYASSFKSIGSLGFIWRSSRFRLKAAIKGGDHHWSHPSEAKGAGLGDIPASPKAVARHARWKKDGVKVRVKVKDRNRESALRNGYTFFTGTIEIKELQSCGSKKGEWNSIPTCINMHQLIGYIYTYFFFGSLAHLVLLRDVLNNWQGRKSQVQAENANKEYQDWRNWRNWFDLQCPTCPTCPILQS